MSVLMESQLSKEDAYYNKIINPGTGWMHIVNKGETIRITDLHGNQAVDTLFYNADDTDERYNSNNTIREQNNVYIGFGTKIRSNENRVMLSITADTCGRHDTLGSACSRESNTVRYSLDKKFMHSCRDTFSHEILKWGNGMNKKDQVCNVNFFMNVPVDPEGGSNFEDGISEPMKYVELKAEMDVIILISNCPQLNNPCNAYNPTDVEVHIWD